jgi:hypothetical protein
MTAVCQCLFARNVTMTAVCQYLFARVVHVVESVTFSVTSCSSTFRVEGNWSSVILLRNWRCFGTYLCFHFQGSQQYSACLPFAHLALTTGNGTQVAKSRILRGAHLCAPLSSEYRELSFSRCESHFLFHISKLRSAKIPLSLPT